MQLQHLQVSKCAQLIRNAASQMVVPEPQGNQLIEFAQLRGNPSAQIDAAQGQADHPDWAALQLDALPVSDGNCGAPVQHGILVQQIPGCQQSGAVGEQLGADLRRELAMRNRQQIMFLSLQQRCGKLAVQFIFLKKQSGQLAQGRQTVWNGAAQAVVIEPQHGQVRKLAQFRRDGAAQGIAVQRQSLQIGQLAQFRRDGAC